MASETFSDSNHLDHSSQSVSSATAAKSKGGRPPHPIKEEFIKVGSSANASKRATYDCKHCNTSFTEQHATNPNLIKHIVSECSQCPSETRQIFSNSSCVSSSSRLGVLRGGRGALVSRLLHWELPGVELCLNECVVRLIYIKYINIRPTKGSARVPRFRRVLLKGLRILRALKQLRSAQ